MAEINWEEVYAREKEKLERDTQLSPDRREELTALLEENLGKYVKKNRSNLK